MQARTSPRTSPFYSDAPLYFVLLLLVALVGFFPSYYSKLGSGQFAHQFHGAMATLWMVLLISQAYLMRQRKIALHRALGKASIVLAALFVVAGLMITNAMLTSDSGFARLRAEAGLRRSQFGGVFRVRLPDGDLLPARRRPARAS
ncbi:hypothetical protein LP420_25550 [Massilia sp. B-10]|nr:hypothetical protein LP420_25550 [Massilia sp. B-10]UUZ52593.1 hypothetical protein LP419_25020 [Massilia sp. H-1]